jgi:cellulose synthase/poly-beta-1,6-N-acetylglucosamine synthase-like glycosyltransferase
VDDNRENLPPIAVVTIGRNEGERLRRCLESILAMDYPAHLLDVIYVDSRSTDGSVDLAREMGVRTEVLQGQTTAGRARNAGWVLADTEFILFLDGDTILHPQFVRMALPAMEDPTIAGVWGHRRELDCKGSVYNAVFDLDWQIPPGVSLYFGGDVLVRREALLTVDGFNGDLIAGEEPDICRRMRGLGYTILHIDAPMTMHDLDMHLLRQYWRRSIRTGYAYAQVASFYDRTSDPFWRAEVRHNLIRGLFWVLGPLLSLTASILFRSTLPFLAFVLVGGCIIGRTGWSIRKKAPSLMLRFAYGSHSHLGKIPIVIGQSRFVLNQRRRFVSELIEYK